MNRILLTLQKINMAARRPNKIWNTDTSEKKQTKILWGLRILEKLITQKKDGFAPTSHARTFSISAKSEKKNVSLNRKLTRKKYIVYRWKSWNTEIFWSCTMTMVDARWRVEKLPRCCHYLFPALLLFLPRLYSTVQYAIAHYSREHLFAPRHRNTYAHTTNPRQKKTILHDFIFSGCFSDWKIRTEKRGIGKK